MNKNSVALAVSLAIGQIILICPASATGIPVVDVTAIAEAVKQYEQMVEQLKQLEAQLDQAKQQYQSITGSRNLGGILSEDYTQNVPKNWQETLNAMSDGGKIGQIASSIAQQASQLDEAHFETVAENIRESLRNSLEGAANSQALNAQIYDNSGNRFGRLKGLMDQINSATDLKSINDLQARIEVENGMLMNELIKLQSMNALVAKRDDVRESEAIQSSFKLRSRGY